MIRSAIQHAASLCSLSVLIAAGCTTPGLFYQPPPPPEMLGTKVDQIMDMQVANADAAKFVVYQHEFELNKYTDGKMTQGLRLNEYGEDHLRRIAEGLRNGAPYPVVVERSQTSAKPGTKYEYPIHFNPNLDMQRREVVVRALTRMAIADAEARVVVAPAFSQGLTGPEAESAYSAALSGGWGGGGGGGGGGGWGGGGGGWF
jgi:hypothetical protein